jgi:hypothetical protein
VLDDDVFDEETADADNKEEEQFQVQLSENDKKYVLVNTRMDYQHRSDLLENMCLYDFVSMLYKKKMNTTDLRYLSDTGAPIETAVNQKGRPPNKRYPFQKEHPQATTHVMMAHSQPHVPVLYGPQIPRRDRDDTRERYSRAILTLFVPWRTVLDLCDTNQTWQDAFGWQQGLIPTHSRNIIENIQLLHECKKDRDEHALKVIAEVQSSNDSIDPLLLPSNRDNQDGQDMGDSDDFLELLGNLDEYTAAAINGTKSLTESKYIQETVEAVESVGRFSDTNGEYCLHGTKKSKVNDANFILAIHQSFSTEPISHKHQQLAPFVPATSSLIRLNTKWIEQLKTEKERVRHGLITGNYDKDDGMLDFDAARDAVVTVIDPKHSDQHNHENYRTIPPVVLLTTNFPSQKTIADEFTLNREQRAAFTIITSHLDGDTRSRTGTALQKIATLQNVLHV